MTATCPVCGPVCRESTHARNRWPGARRCDECRWPIDPAVDDIVHPGCHPDGQAAQRLARAELAAAASAPARAALAAARGAAA